jgi:hypothetical protein
MQMPSVAVSFGGVQFDETSRLIVQQSVSPSGVRFGQSIFPRYFFVFSGDARPAKIKYTAVCAVDCQRAKQLLALALV